MLFFIIYRENYIFASPLKTIQVLVMRSYAYEINFISVSTLSQVPTSLM